MNPSIETFTNRGLAMKREGTEGTDSGPTAALNAFQMLEGTSKIVADPIERNIDRPFFNGRRTKYTNFRLQVNGTAEVVPPATPGTGEVGIGLALEIAGMAVTKTASAPPGTKGKHVYNPISRLIPSASGYWYHAGTLRKAVGMRTNISGLAMEIDKNVTMQLAIEGALKEFKDEAFPSDWDFSQFLEPTPYTTESGELTINDFAVFGKLLAVDFGNQIKTISHTEARVARIGDKQSTFKCRFYRTSLADFDPYAKWRAGDIIELKGINVETGGGRQTVMNVRGEIGGVDDANIDGDFGYEISGKCVASDAGNDETLLGFEEV